MKMQHSSFRYILYFSIPLRKLPEAFRLTSSKSWFPHYFNTEANFDYVGPIPEMQYFGADEMSEGERISCHGIMNRKTKSLTVDMCWRSTVRMTSPS
jgi:hypothetical protein